MCQFKIRRNQASIKWSLLILFIVTFNASCSPSDGLVETAKKPKSAEGDSKKNTPKSKAPVDLSEACGTKKDAAPDEDYVVFSQNMKSLPFNLEGNKLGLIFKIKLDAALSVEAKRRSGMRNNLTVSVLNVEVDAKSPILKVIGLSVAKSKAKADAAKKSAPVETKSLSTGEWLNLTVENPEYKDLKCATQAAKELRTIVDGKEGEVNFAPGLPNSINPRASRETIETELAEARTFKVVANVIKAIPSWPEGSIDGTVTIKPRDPTFTTPDGKTYSSDLAFTVTSTFPVDPKKYDVSQFASTRSFFVNTQSKEFDAILEETQAENDGIKMPVIFILRE